MANPTTNFGWVMPTSTSLVTNLPADFNTFGQAVDTSMQYLKGGTTGQILSKTSATDMAFTWITNDVGDITAVTAGTGLSGGGTSGSVTLAIDSTVATLTGTQTLTNKTLTSPALTTPTISTLSTNGDLLYGTGSGALSRLGIGSTSQVLTVTGGVPVWATPAGGGKVLQVVQATYSTATVVASTTMTDTGLSASITPSSASSKVLVFFTQEMRVTRQVSSAFGAMRILRGATSIYEMGATGNETSGVITDTLSAPQEVSLNNTISASYLDSPATTSSTTYKTQGKTSSTANSGSATFNRGDTTAVMILMEIGA